MDKLDTVLRALATGGLSLIINEGWSTNSTGSGCCSGGHTWVWGGDIPGWPYDGMPCSCGATKYDKVEELGKQIRALEEELTKVQEERQTVV